MTTPLKIGIVGAGFSGVSLVANLAAISNCPLEVYLFDKTGNFGLGAAYSTKAPYHLLNVASQNMSALESDKDHFSIWLDKNNYQLKNTNSWQDAFVPRYLYGTYLQSILDEASSSKYLRLTKLSVDVTGIFSEDQQLNIQSQNTSLRVDKVVLAMGNQDPISPKWSGLNANNYLSDPWHADAFKKIDQDDAVLILGTGLSMIDSVLTLIHQQHVGKIYSVSRHGLLPLPHGNQPEEYFFVSDEIPDRALQLSRYLREICKVNMQDGKDWQSILNAFRAYIPAVWEGLSLVERSRFLRHAQSFWNVHRHRIPDRVLNQIVELQCSGQLEIVCGRITDFNNETAFLKCRGSQQIKNLPVKWVVNCMGPSSDLRQSPLIRTLLDKGLADCDPLELGLQVSPRGALVMADGSYSSDLFALGPLCRGAFWEITSVPDIRRFTKDLALVLLTDSDTD